MSIMYDVAVIGAGPGGSRAALDCSVNGLKTIIFEKKPVVGRPVHCGECLSEVAAQNTGLTIPEHVVSTYVKGIRVVFPDKSEKKLYESGYVLDKDKFEQWLSGKACSNGAVLRLNSGVTALSYIKDNWIIKTGSGEDIRSKIVIDASGVQSVSLNLLKKKLRFSVIVGFQYELEDIQTDEFISFYLWPKLAPGGYLWIIPKGGGTANVGLITTQTKKIKQILDKFIRIMDLNPDKIKKKFGGRIPASGPLVETFSRGLMLVGDAAGFTSPLFEGGTHLALKSGCIAASFAHDAVILNDFSKNHFSGYQKKWMGIFPDYKQLLKGKEILYNLADSELNLTAQYIPEKIIGFSNYKKILTILNIAFHNPKILMKGGADMLRAFELSRAKHYGW